MRRHIGNCLFWVGCHMAAFSDWLHTKANDVCLLGQEMGCDQ